MSLSLKVLGRVFLPLIVLMLSFFTDCDLLYAGPKSKKTQILDVHSDHFELQVKKKNNWNYLLLQVTGQADYSEYYDFQNIENPSRMKIWIRGGVGDYQIKIYAIRSPSLYENIDSEYLTGFKFSKTKDVNLDLSPSGRVQSEDIQIKTLALELMREITNSEMEDVEKVRTVKNWIVANIDYDTQAYVNYLNQIYEPGPSNALTVLRTRKAMCHGISSLAAALLRAVGIEVRIVYGEISYDGWRTKMPHDWNQIKLNGIWYNLDITWDMGYMVVKDGQFQFSKRYGLENYFLKTNSELTSNHRFIRFYID